MKPGKKLLLILAAALITLLPRSAAAHCDSMNGPVVKAGEKALAAGDVNLVLMWVRKEDEKEIRDAFAQTLAVRKLSDQARALADKHFFETLVRVHRAGEGEPFTGLKPSEYKAEEGIVLADKAFEHGSIEHLERHLVAAVREGLTHKFKTLMAKKNFVAYDVAKGREFVAAYVEFIHFAERLLAASRAAAHTEPGAHEHNTHEH